MTPLDILVMLRAINLQLWIYKITNNISDMKTIAFTEIPNIPKNTSGYVGHLDSKDGLFIEWLPTGSPKIVLRKDSIDYKQDFDEFIRNCR